LANYLFPKMLLLETKPAIYWHLSQHAVSYKLKTHISEYRESF